MKQYCSILFSIIFFLSFSSITYADPSKSLCPSGLDDGLLNFAWECINDTVMFVVDSETADANSWQYTIDSDLDGVEGGAIGGTTFEIYGLAFREIDSEIWVVINANLPFDGYSSRYAADGHIGYGDVFFNFSGADFETASTNGDLYAVRFDERNDSGAPQIGVYNNVSAKSVTGVNQGFKHLAHYESYVNKKGGFISYGDLPEGQTYYAQSISLNVIDSGDYLAPITLLTSNDLLNAGYDMLAYEGSTTVAFKFDKSLIIDVCGVFGGDGTSCLDCSGTPCGKAVVDQCNVCGGDGTSCLDCAGTPNGDAKIDQCGVCGGDGKSCLDCAGTPFGDAEVDQCGVCGGDGTSCLDCTETDLTESLLSLDSGSAQLQNDLNSSLRLLTRYGNAKKANRAYATKIRAQGLELHLNSWQLSWTLPRIVHQCGNTSLCKSSDNSFIISSYQDNAKKMLKLTKKVIRKLRRQIGKKVGVKILKRAKSHFNTIVDKSTEFPNTNSTCSGVDF